MELTLFCFPLTENISAAIQFDTASGTLTARRSGEMITLDFPLNETQPMVRLFIFKKSANLKW